MLSTHFFNPTTLIIHHIINFHSMQVVVTDNKRSFLPLSIAVSLTYLRHDLIEQLPSTLRHLSGWLPSKRAHAKSSVIQFPRVKNIVFSKKMHPACSNHLAQKVHLQDHTFITLMLLHGHGDGSRQLWRNL